MARLDAYDDEVLLCLSPSVIMIKDNHAAEGRLQKSLDTPKYIYP